MGGDKHGLDPSGSGTSWRRIGLLLSLVLAAALAVAIASRTSAEAMTIVVAVVCGIAAGIPTSMFLLAMMSRRERNRYGKPGGQSQAGGYPPVVVVPPEQREGHWSSLPPGSQMQRRFHIIDGKELVDDR